MKNSTFFIILPVFMLVVSCQPENKGNENPALHKAGIQPKDSLIKLSNGELSLTIDQYGGAFTQVSLTNQAINPLSWGVTSEQMPENNKDGAPFRGHFLCLGRWGAPSPGEIAAGIPHNGEQSNTQWTVAEISENRVVMENEAPLDGLMVKREVSIVDEQSAYLVKEWFKNTSSLGRVSNVVQHITLGKPFLNPNTVLNSNARKGFNQGLSYPDPYAYEFEWPIAYLDSVKNTTDVRSTKTPDNYCMTYLFDPKDKYGWITAYDPVSGILLGYVWILEEYRWINIWSHYQDGTPQAKGIEFGTTGIGRKYQDLLEIDTRFYGQNSWEYIDAGEEKVKSFLGFMMDMGKGKENLIVEVTDSIVAINNKYSFKNLLTN